MEPPINMEKVEDLINEGKRFIQDRFDTKDIAQRLDLGYNATIDVLNGVVANYYLKLENYIEDLKPSPLTLSLGLIFITLAFLGPKPLRKERGRERSATYLYLAFSMVFSRIFITSVFIHIPSAPGFNLERATSMFLPFFLCSVLSVIMLHYLYVAFNECRFRLGNSKTRKHHTSFFRDWFELFSNAHTVAFWVVVFYAVYSSDVFLSPLHMKKFFFPEGSDSVGYSDFIFSQFELLHQTSQLYVDSIHRFRTIFVLTTLTFLFLSLLEYIFIRKCNIRFFNHTRFISSGIPFETHVQWGDAYKPSHEKCMPMTSWYSLYLTHTMLDMILSAMEFLGRTNTRQVSSIEPILETKSGDENLSSLGVFDLSISKGDFYLDWMADCGDGWNPSYQVARGLADPNLRVECSPKLAALVKERSNPAENTATVDSVAASTSATANGGQKNNGKKKKSKKTSSDNNEEEGERKVGDRISYDADLVGHMTLPRAKVLIIGGDLAYPNPTHLNYENRLVYPFESAMKSPTSYDPESLVFKSVTDREIDLNNYKGPVCFAIPGNHDWFDGAQNFRKKIVNKNYLGGWKLPQSKNYYAIKLPHDWWFFGVDNGLTMDINIEQLEYFTKVTATMSANAKVILGTHEPDWLTCNRESYKGTAPLLNLLLKTLKKKAKVRIAGDVHHYSRYVLEDENQSKFMQPIHWIVSGGGGAFLHPTHVFPKSIDRAYSWHKKPGQPASDTDEIPAVKNVADFPGRLTSRSMAWENIYKFRQENWLFDCMGALMYYLIVYTLIPQLICMKTSHILQTNSIPEFLTTFARQVVSLQVEVMSTLNISSFMTLFFFWMCCTFSGGLKIQTVLHFYCHWFGSISIMLVMNLWMYLGILTGLITESGTVFKRLTAEFSESINNCNERTSFLNFGDGVLCERLMKDVLMCLEWPELLKELRAFCPNTDDAMKHTILFHWVFFVVYWMIASLVVATIFSIYLALYGYFGNYHFDEPYSSLRHQGYKNFVRFRIDADSGELEAFSIGMRSVPKKWKTDPEWKHDPKRPSYESNRPSKFIPSTNAGKRADKFELIDYFSIS